MPTSRLLLLVPFLLVAFSARPAAAQAEQPVEDITISYAFGDQITISGRVSEDVAYDAISLHIVFPGDANTLTALLQPDADGSFSYTHHIEDRFIQAFSEVGFRFVLTRTGGILITSETFTFFYSDNRFSWQTLEAPPFTLHWYEGDTAFAQQILDAADAGLERGKALLGVQTIAPVDLYIYAQLSDYQFSRGQLGQLWAGGHADPAAGLVIVSLVPGPEAQIEIERKIPHEVAHLVLSEAAGMGYWNLPTWLNEGFASLLETFPNPDYDFLVAASLSEGTTIPLTELCDAFPVDASGALQAYAQATSLVRQIESQYGPAGLRALVDSYAAGAGCATGTQVEPVNLALADLDTAWQTSLLDERAPEAVDPSDALRTALPWLIFVAAVLVGPGLVLIGTGIRKGIGNG